MTEIQNHPDATTLDRFRTAELESAEHERVAAHLASCASCARALADLEAFADSVGRAYAARRAIDVRPEPDWDELRARIAAGTAAEGLVGERPASQQRERESRSAWIRWAPQAAAAVLAIVVAGVLWREGVQGPEDARRLVEPSAPNVAAADRDGKEASTTAPSAELGHGERRAPGDFTEQERFRAAPFEDERVPPAPRAQAEAEPARDAERTDAPVERLDRGAQGVVRQGEAREENMAAAANRIAADPATRFEIEARDALARSDTTAAARALELWRDSLDVGADLPLERRRAARALADSLIELVDPVGIPPE
jgi:hypothetical protein